MTITVISHPDCLRHDMGPDHPESPARLAAIDDRLLSSGLDFVLRHATAPLATRDQLLRVHTARHVDDVFTRVPASGLVALDPETLLGPHSLAAARRAAGAAVAGVDRVMADGGAVFCKVRPPGHHATRDRAMGFCIFNNVAVGAAHALAVHGVERLAILDFDIHHGNGTEDIFRDDPRVLMCSTFQYPFYPHPALTDTPANIVHVPLAAGSGSDVFRRAVQDHWLPALDGFRPQLVLVSAGFDGHVEDSQSDTLLTDRDFHWVTARIREVAERHAAGRVVSVLEGGYALAALGRCVATHLDALLGNG